MLSRFVVRPAAGLWLATAVLIAAGCAGRNTEAPKPVPPPVAARSPDSAHAQPQVARKPKAQKPRAPRPAPPSARPAVDSIALERAITARFAHRPLALALARQTRNGEVAELAAAAVVREAGPLQMSPSLLGAVLLIENRGLDSSAVSSQGAVGLMQVMPMHAGGYGCSSTNLRQVYANVCHGARLLHRYIVRTGSVQIALRRYNGCVRGANTPRCHRYPAMVLRTASRLRQDILAGAAEMGLIVPASTTEIPGRKRPAAGL
jgi:soluble lytic murein transglycosylase-like protein